MRNPLILGFITFGLCQLVHAQILTNPTISGQTPEEARPRLIQPVYRLNYSLSTDFADSLKPRKFDHGIEVAPLFVVKQSWLLLTDLQATYYSLDNTIPTDHNFQLSDGSLGAGKLIHFGPNSMNDLLLTVGNNFPLSEKSQFEGTAAIPSAHTMAILKFPQFRTMLSNDLGVAYYVNANQFSPLTGSYTQQFATSDQIGLTYFILDNWSVSAGGGIKNTVFKDGFSQFDFKNFFTTDVYIGDVWYAELGYENGTYSDNTKVDLWYIDQYRQVSSFTLGATF